MIIKIAIGVVTLLTPSASQAAVAQSVAESSAPPMSVSFRYTTDVAHGLSGGLARKGSWVGSLGLSADLDLQRLSGLRGADAHIEALGTHGIRSTGAIGDLQGTSSIAAPTEMRLYQAYLRQRLLEDRVSLLVGIHDLNLEFNATESSAVFAHASFGMGPELAMSGAAGPSAYPMTAAGARLRVLPLEGLELAAGVYDGDPTSWEIDGRQGAISVAEIAQAISVRGLRGRVAVGGWKYSERAGFGGYLTYDQRVYEPVIGGATGLGVFGRVGAADSRASAVDWSLVSGVAYTGLVPGRGDDVLGLGAAMAAAGSGRETALELTYQAQVLPGFKVQPDLMWIVDPGMDASVDDAFAGGVRVEVAL